MSLQHFRIVMSNTSHPGNIGAAARAMKTMGIHQLYLVQPKHFPAPEATAMPNDSGSATRNTTNDADTWVPRNAGVQGEGVDAEEAVVMDETSSEQGMKRREKRLRAGCASAA